MKMYLISDNLDTLTGMRLAGVDGIVVHERDELKETIEKAMSDPEIWKRISRIDRRDQAGAENAASDRDS